MKCIISTKSTKHVSVGDVKRVDNDEATTMVSSGYWKYTSKTEFRKYVNSVTPQKTESSEPTEKKTPSKKKDKKIDKSPTY
jgi:hypothetical protein